MQNTGLFFNKMQSLEYNLKVNSIWRMQYLITLLFGKKRKKQFYPVNVKKDQKPLVYSCSGCSGAAQMANYLALQLERNGIAEMSCIAGVGANVKELLTVASSGRMVITIDGCSLACSKNCLKNHALHPDRHFELTTMGVKKGDHEDFDLREASKIFWKIKRQVLEPDEAY